MSRCHGGLAFLLLAGVSGAFVACAQAGVKGIGSGGNMDFAVGGGPGGFDLAGGSSGGPDFAGLDLYGVDLTGVGSNHDLAVNCNLVTQTGCGAGEKCTLGPSCSTDGTLVTGAACDPKADACIHGNQCLTFNGASGSDCRQFCNGDADCKQPAAPGGATNVGHCIYTVGAADMSPPIQVCSVPCNPIPAVGASGCATGLACSVFATATINQLTGCEPPGTVGDGGDCSMAACIADFTCVQVGTGASAVDHCRKVCRPNQAGTDCPAGGYTCVVPTGSNILFGFCCPSGNC